MFTIFFYGKKFKKKKEACQTKYKIWSDFVLLKGKFLEPDVLVAKRGREKKKLVRADDARSLEKLI